MALPLRDPLKLNLGCGSQKIPGFLGIDSEKKSKPDIVHDFIKFALPFDESSVDEIVMFHTIEHIQKKHHSWILKECHRVLRPGKKIYISYPDFWICANNWKNNEGGQRDFWHNTMFGLQQYPSDYHVCAMDAQELEYKMKQFGFEEVHSTPEKKEKYNKITVGVKGSLKQVSYESEVLKDFNSIRIK